MKIDVENRNDGAILHLDGKVIGDGTRQLKRVIDEQIGFGSMWLIVNLAEVPLIDSSALGSILMGFLKLKEKKRKLVLLYPQKTILEVLAITKLDSLFEVYDDLQSALRAVEPELI